MDIDRVHLDAAGAAVGIDNLQLGEMVRVSELLEIPAVVATTDLLGLMPVSMESDGGHRWLPAIVIKEVRRA
jgi:hypothetical protein